MPRLTQQQRAATIRQIHSVLSTASFRQIHDDKLQQAARLVNEYGLHKSIVAAYLRVSRPALDRALRALKDGREIGKNGRPPILNEEEEEELVAFIGERMEARDNATCAQVIAEASSLYKKRMLSHAQMLAETEDGMEIELPADSIHRHWLYGFVARHPQLKIGKGSTLEHDRRKSCTPTAINEYFDVLEELMAKNEYPPSMIANFDETMIDSSKSRPKVVTNKECKIAYSAENDALPHITLGVTIFADGSHAKTLVIYPNVYLPAEVDESSLAQEKNLLYAGQEKGWINSQIFEEYCRKVIINEFASRAEHFPPNQRGLLLLDGHSSRANPDLLELLKSKGVDVLTFVSHSSHVLQPLDVLVFGEFKKQLRAGSSALRRLTLPEKRVWMLSNAKKALHMSFFEDYVKKSFIKAGVFPLNRAHVLKHPGIGVALADSPESPTKASRKKRNAVDINCRVISSDEAIAELRARPEKMNKSSSTNSNKQRKIQEDTVPHSQLDDI